MSTGCGFTELATKLLSVPRSCTLSSGPKVLGGLNELDETTAQRCFARMANFVSLVIASLQAEFPSYEVIQSFSLFGLDGECVPGQAALAQKEATQRLSMVFNVDAARLGQQIIDAKPHAKYLVKQRGCSAMEAWGEVLRKLSDRRLRKTHPSSELVVVAHRYLAFSGCSTSGVEQNFSILRRIFPPQRGGLVPRLEAGELSLHIGIEENDFPIIIAAARKIWGEVYGEARRSPLSPKFRSGVRCKNPLRRPTSEAAWLVARRAAVDQLASTSRKRPFAAVDTDALQRGQSEWCTELAEEARKLGIKARSRKVLAATAGHLLSSELSPELREESNAMQKHQFKRDMEMARQEARVALAVSPTAPIELNTAKVHIDGKLRKANSEVDARVRREAQRHSMHVVFDRWQSDILIVPRLADPGQRAILIAGLYGRRIAGPELILNNGENAASIKFQRAVATRRWLWISTGCAMHHSSVVDIVRSAAISAESRWTVLPSQRAFLKKTLASMSGPVRQHRRYDAIALVRGCERTGLLGTMPNVFTIAMFMNFLFKADTCDSIAGVCGR